MPGKQNDRRVQYTKMVLKQGLVGLMKEAKIDTITVTDICKAAGVNRGTFYAHYNDPADLLHQIEEELFDTIRATLTKKNAEGVPVSANEWMLGTFQCIMDNRELCQILLGKNGDVEFLRRVLRITKDLLYDSYKQKAGEVDETQFAYVYAFIANGSIGLIQNWIQDGMKESPEFLVSILDKVRKGAGEAFF